MDADLSVSRRCFFEKIPKRRASQNNLYKQTSSKESSDIVSLLLLIIATARPNWMKTSSRWGEYTWCGILNFVEEFPGQKSSNKPVQFYIRIARV